MTNPIESLTASIAFDARDWSQGKTDAWIYGIVLGWGRAIYEVAALHGWRAEEVERLKELHRNFMRIRRTRSGNQGDRRPVKPPYLAPVNLTREGK